MTDQLFRAIENNDVGAMEALLSRDDIDVNAMDLRGYTVLMVAVRYERVNIVEALLSREDINVNAASISNHTALMFAATQGHMNIVAALLSHEDIDTDVADDNGDTALSYAATGQFEVVKAIIAKGANVNAVGYGGWTPLMTVASNGHVGSVKALLGAKGINVNAVNNYGETALFHAAKNGHTDVVNALLQAGGIDINTVTNNGWKSRYVGSLLSHEFYSGKVKWGDIRLTPLKIAAASGHTDVVKRLLEVPGVGVNTGEGLTALDLAIAGDHAVIVGMLAGLKGSIPTSEVYAKAKTQTKAMIDACATFVDGEIWKTMRLFLDTNTPLNEDALVPTMVGTLKNDILENCPFFKEDQIYGLVKSRYLVMMERRSAILQRRGGDDSNEIKITEYIGNELKRHDWLPNEEIARLLEHDLMDRYGVPEEDVLGRVKEQRDILDASARSRGVSELSM